MDIRFQSNDSMYSSVDDQTINEKHLILKLNWNETLNILKSELYEQNDENVTVYQ